MSSSAFDETQPAACLHQMCKHHTHHRGWCSLRASSLVWYPGCSSLSAPVLLLVPFWLLLNFSSMWDGASLLACIQNQPRQRCSFGHASLKLFLAMHGVRLLYIGPNGRHLPSTWRRVSFSQYKTFDCMQDTPTACSTFSMKMENGKTATGVRRVRTPAVNNGVY